MELKSITEFFSELIEKLAGIDKRLAKVESTKVDIDKPVTPAIDPLGTSVNSYELPSGEKITDTKFQTLEMIRQVRPAHGLSAFLHRLARLWVYHSVLVKGGGDHTHGYIMEVDNDPSKYADFNGSGYGIIFPILTDASGVKRLVKLEYFCTKKWPDIIHPPLNHGDPNVIQYMQIDLLQTVHPDGRVVIDHEKFEGHDACLELLRKWWQPQA